MTEIDLTPEQVAYVQALRDELAEEVTYGTVRLQDAVQYLIDHHREDGDLDVEVDEPDVDVEEDAAADGGLVHDDSDPGADEGQEGDDADGDADATDDPLGDAGGKVEEMMSLLEDNDDVWSEVEEGYEVELPDGDVEQARTKDDVRALLFQHYR